MHDHYSCGAALWSGIASYVFSWLAALGWGRRFMGVTLVITPHRGAVSELLTHSLAGVRVPFKK